MSSPASRRSQRNSQSATPARISRTSQQPPSSPAAAVAPRQATSEQQDANQGTPRVSRQNVPSSSPLFFRSSPVNGDATAHGADRMDISSPLRQASGAEDNDGTPRGRPQPPDGELPGILEEAMMSYADFDDRIIAHTLCVQLKSRAC